MKAISRKYKYYEIFNISRTATAFEIRKAYRILVKKYHPDVNSDPQAGETVKKINKIYGILSNEKMRKEYDDAEAECPECYSHRFFQDQGAIKSNSKWKCKDCGRSYIFEKLTEKVKTAKFDAEICLLCGNDLRFDGFLRLFVCKKCGERFSYKEIHNTATTTSKAVRSKTEPSSIGTSSSYKALRLTTGITFFICVIVSLYLLYVTISTSSAFALGISIICICFTVISWYIFSYPQIVISTIKALMIKRE
ncbi:J domain-containing protein [Chloroflexota bacterium]